MARDRPRGLLGQRSLYGDAGNDTLHALDGLTFTDGLCCGAGTDSCTTDTRDRKTAGCE
ncbi:MAG: hypothetical protein LC798_01935 [Chloroflexi bacterium]|nr:hypothetical protein [Chloroflexota bacterium]